MTSAPLARFCAYGLAVIGIAAMALSDDRIYAFVPLLLGLCVVLVMGGLLLWRRIDLPFPCVVMAALPFLVTACLAPSLFEGCTGVVLILSAVVYYLLGWYGGLLHLPSRSISLVMMVGVLANLIFFLLSHLTAAPLLCWGRAAEGLLGTLSRPCAMFVYKNFASAFLCCAGAYLIAQAWWRRNWQRRELLALAMGALSLLFACCCGSRVPFLLLPLLLVSMWLLRLLMRAGRVAMGWGDAFFLFLLLLFACYLLDDVLGANLAMQYVLGADSHLRYDIWAALYEHLPSVPFYGLGWGASQWLIVPSFDEWCSPNYAHNEYLQAWVDGGWLGLLLVLLLLIGHVGYGLYLLMGRQLSYREKLPLASALLVLVGMAFFALVDFGWHHFSLLAITAFSCGFIAAPRGQLHPCWLHARFLWTRRVGTTLVVASISLVFALLLLRFAPVYWGQWGLSEDLLWLYPDARAIRKNMQNHPPSNREQLWKNVALLQLAQKENPHNLFALLLQVDVLTRLDEYERADAFMQSQGFGEQMPNTRLAPWLSYYTRNLLYWGIACAAQGEHAEAKKHLIKGLSLVEKHPLRFNFDYRQEPKAKQLRQSYVQHEASLRDLVQLCKKILEQYHVFLPWDCKTRER